MWSHESEGGDAPKNLEIPDALKATEPEILPLLKVIT